jgi:hypothetical protein
LTLLLPGLYQVSSCSFFDSCFFIPFSSTYAYPLVMPILSPSCLALPVYPLRRSTASLSLARRNLHLVHHPLFFILRTHPLRQSAVSLFWLEDPRAGSPASLAWSFDCEDIVCQSFSLLCPAYASTLCECSHRHRILAIISWHDSAYRYPVLTRKRYVYLRAGIILLHTHRSLVLPPRGHRAHLHICLFHSSISIFQLRSCSSYPAAIRAGMQLYNQIATLFSRHQPNLDPSMGVEHILTLVCPIQSFMRLQFVFRRHSRRH